MDGKKYFLFNIKNVANQHGQARGFPLISRKEIYDMRKLESELNALLRKKTKALKAFNELKT